MPPSILQIGIGHFKGETIVAEFFSQFSMKENKIKLSIGVQQSTANISNQSVISFELV